MEAWQASTAAPRAVRGGSQCCAQYASAVTDSTPLPVPSGGVTSSGCISRLALDSVESTLYFLLTSSYNSDFFAKSEVSSTRYVPVNDLTSS